MAHGYRTLQNWNQWLSQNFLGRALLQGEHALLSRLLARHMGKHTLLVGVPHQYELLNTATVPCHTLISPIISPKETKYNQIESELRELPILTGSIDLVILPHTLQFVDNPRQLLSEACRIIKPEGLIAISGFNPYSAWGLKKILNKKTKSVPWSINFIHLQQVKNWLHLADFAMEKQASILFRPPVKEKMFERLHFFENLGAKLFPNFGGVYVVLARAKVIPLTPIKMTWKQQLSGITASTTISGHIARRE